MTRMQVFLTAAYLCSVLLAAAQFVAGVGVGTPPVNPCVNPFERQRKDIFAHISRFRRRRKPVDSKAESTARGGYAKRKISEIRRPWIELCRELDVADKHTDKSSALSYIGLVSV